MVCCALASHPHKNFHIRELKTTRVVRAKVTDKGFKKLQTLRCRADDNLSIRLWLGSRCRVECGVSRSEALAWEVLPLRSSEAEFTSVGQWNGVRGRIERELARECHSCYDRRRREEVHRLSIAVIPCLEIPSVHRLSVSQHQKCGPMTYRLKEVKIAEATVVSSVALMPSLTITDHSPRSCDRRVSIVQYTVRRHSQAPPRQRPAMRR